MKQGRKRTKITTVKSNAPIISLHFEDMVLDSGNGLKSYTHRLRYCHVPTMVQIRSGKGVLANRDDIVRDIHQRLNPLPENRSKQKYFSGLVTYFKYLDGIGHHGDLFANTVMIDCIKHFNKLREKGVQVSVAGQIKCSLSFLLRLWNRESDLKTLPEVAARAPAANKAFHVETELKPLSKVLVKGALAFQEAIENNELLDIHPFFDEERFDEQVRRNNWTLRQSAKKKRGFKQCMKPQAGTLKTSPLPLEQLHRQVFYNQASRNWFFVFSMLTGMNTSVLANVQHKDVSFKNIGSGRFVFDGEKFRAGYKDLDNSAGFSLRTKELITRWLQTSKVMYQSLGITLSNELPLCPFFNANGEVWTFNVNGTNIGYINTQLEKITGLTVTTSRFRATKSDVLMRVTEDIFLVSQGLNNSVNVVAKRYSSGVQADHDNNLNATFGALSAVAKGEEIGKAIEDAKAMRSDILSDFDYKNLRSRESKEQPLMTTPSGIKCAGATPEKLIAEARRMKQLGIDFSKDAGRCTDFLACFDCDSHKLVASENDIWLMLSFLEQIEDLKEMVASNSAPKDEYFVVEGLLKKVLLRLKQKAPKNYAQAKQKVDDGEYHPLYQDRASASQFFKG
ncbi:hypothetical protein AB4455_03055 [Vibrio sp. 10N.261.46.E12]|uniref:hypothetical protein n=1 Tax=unclassified Vibrio TaxID=2614977 RepID=UPI000977BE15|nr:MULTISPECIES: hypothetical protein [unclassified Vibrio]OMO37683.1 hypothetical protein BH584_21525 [Vibrio sp. 10N.261.45.E1]PMJ26261.1 hypothetical protein BCU27_09525 [Vibrio sp. 10N.286.45.B6]PML86990.1 hypothetical protein BCT66_13105 [Vibrio sp. 10N.261.49.E11]PMM78647.1 hypothetical protein BCT48_01140 [Vibrio sp. 10N.261.46.F12]PMM85767.1 hypothetical protein BCT46_08885 [Vibrio sp. 10N.261.46.E8]